MSVTTGKNNNEDEYDWEKIINDLDLPDLDENGTPAPSMESIEQGMDDVGNFSRLTMEVFFFVDKNNDRTYTKSIHYMVDYGEVPLNLAIKEIKNRGFKKS